MSFETEIQKAKKPITTVNDVKQIAEKLATGIRNHVLSLASNVNQVNSFSCGFEICLGKAEINIVSVKNSSEYLLQKEISKTDRRISELVRNDKTEIFLSREALELHEFIQQELKVDGIEVSDIFVAAINISGTDICDGDYRIGWKQDNVVFEVDKISRKTSPTLGSNIYDPNTVVPCGEISKMYSFNPLIPIVCHHNYRKHLIDPTYTAKAYLEQNAEKELMAKTDYPRKENTTIGYCFKVQYTDK